MGVHPATVEELYRTEISLHPQVRTHVTTFFTQMQEGIEGESMSIEYVMELDNRVKIRKCAPMLEEDVTTAKSKIPCVPAMDQPTILLV